MRHLLLSFEMSFDLASHAIPNVHSHAVKIVFHENLDFHIAWSKWSFRVRTKIRLKVPNIRALGGHIARDKLWLDDTCEQDILQHLEFQADKVLLSPAHPTLYSALGVSLQK